MEVCYHNLIACVPDNVTPETVENREAYHEVCRQTIEQFVGRIISELPRETSDIGVVGVLDPINKAVFRLPRERRVPETKPATRWEKFAAKKGIAAKKKKGLLVYDEVDDDYKMRWGRHSLKKAEEKREAIIEVKAGDDPFQDPFELRSQEKSLKKSKQKLQEIQNKVRGAGYKLRDNPNRVAPGGKTKKRPAPGGKRTAQKRRGRK